MWLWWVLAVAILVLSIVWGLLCLTANGMSDAPASSSAHADYWPALLGIGIALAIMVWRLLS